MFAITFKNKIRTSNGKRIVYQSQLHAAEDKKRLEKTFPESEFSIIETRLRKNIIYRNPAIEVTP